MGYKLAILILREIGLKFSISLLKAWLKLFMTPQKQKYYFFECNPKWGPYVDFIEFVVCAIIKRKEEKESELASATGAENRAMSQLIFKLNKY